MASISSISLYTTTNNCCSTRRDQCHNSHNQKLNGTPSFFTTKVHAYGLRTSDAHSNDNDHAIKEHRLNIPREKQFVDPYRQAHIVDGVIYRQTLVVRSYEVGPDKTATIESIISLFQETALSHVWMTGLLSDGYGATHAMKRNNLIWVVSTMQVEVDHYPLWGEIVQIDTWVGASGKNGMRRDWILRNHGTGLPLARGTSTWCMMDRETRRLARMPEDVRDEISQWFTEKRSTKHVNNRIGPLDEKTIYVNPGLEPKRSDLDVNNHVNNVKYVKWMVEAVPDEFQDKHQLTSIRLEYKKECNISDIVQSLCQPREEGMVKDGEQQNSYTGLLNGFSKGNFEGNELVGWFEEEPFGFKHSLQIKGKAKSEEILRGHTLWKRKISAATFELKH